MPEREIHPAFVGEMAASYDQRNEPLAALREALLFLTGRLFQQDLPETAHILCVGAGTGQEILHLAPLAPGWKFTALDPSADMLTRCRVNLGKAGLLDRCHLVHGYVDELDDGITHDAATSILASHFITDIEARRTYFTDIAARLRPSACLVNADLAGDRTTRSFDALEHAWLSALRATGMNAKGVASYRENLDKSVGLLAPSSLADLIASAGFTPPVQFYQAGLIHGHFARRT